MTKSLFPYARGRASRVYRMRTACVRIRLSRAEGAQPRPEGASPGEAGRHVPRERNTPFKKSVFCRKTKDAFLL